MQSKELYAEISKAEHAYKSDREGLANLTTTLAGDANFDKVYQNTLSVQMKSITYLM